MIDNKDIWRVAKLLVRAHGENDEAIAAQHVDERLAEGDLVGRDIRRQVLAATQELHRTKLKLGERVKLKSGVLMNPLHKPTTLGDFLSEEDLDAIRGPLEKARGLPGCAYGAGFYALEQLRLFPRSWCAVAFASEIAEPGDAVPVDLAGWPLLLVRGKDRQLRGFLNICRHCAMPVLPERGKASVHFLAPGTAGPTTSRRS
jgi:hypothetical protein